jgi:ribosomal protein S18 acetylase RimI-like enzyme
VITVRPAHADELDEVGELTVRAYAEWLEPDDFYVRQLRDAATRAREAEVYVALLGQDLAGTVTFCPQESPWSEIAQPGEGEFRMLAVDPAHRRQGVAEALVGVCLERARELGYDALVLSSLAEQAPAQRIYQRLGFIRVPDRDWSPVEGVDLMAFVLRLAEDA